MGAGSSKGTNESVEGSKSVNEMPEICKQYIQKNSTVRPPSQPLLTKQDGLNHAPKPAPNPELKPVAFGPTGQPGQNGGRKRKTKPKSKRVKRGKRKSVRR